MSRYSPLLVGILTLLGAAVAHGIWSDRWTTPPEVLAGVVSLEHIPTFIGSWEGHDQALEPGTRWRADVKGWLYRKYVHRQTGEEISVAILCGRPGPIATHSPDVCYTSSGYTMASTPAKRRIPMTDGKASAEMWEATFTKEVMASIPEKLQVCWAWNATGQWEAVSEPRIAFASHSLLYKLYVIRKLRAGEQERDDHACGDFIRSMMVELNRKLLLPGSELVRIN